MSQTPLSSVPALRMTDPATIEAERMRLDRRQSARRNVTGRVTALASEADHDSAETRKRLCSLQLKDMSDTGIGAHSADPIPAGTDITVFFPPHGPERGFDLVGTVVRCESREWGYDIGIALTTHQYRAA